MRKTIKQIKALSQFFRITESYAVEQLGKKVLKQKERHGKKRSKIKEFV